MILLRIKNSYVLNITLFFHDFSFEDLEVRCKNLNGVFILCLIFGLLLF